LNVIGFLGYLGFQQSEKDIFNIIQEDDLLNLCPLKNVEVSSNDQNRQTMLQENAKTIIGLLVPRGNSCLYSYPLSYYYPLNKLRLLI